MYSNELLNHLRLRHFFDSLGCHILCDQICLVIFIVSYIVTSERCLTKHAHITLSGLLHLFAVRARQFCALADFFVYGLRPNCALVLCCCLALRLCRERRSILRPATLLRCSKQPVALLLRCSKWPIMR